jgi:hypothetical protein
MKLTIVLDTDDPDGMKDAYKIAVMLLQKHVGLKNNAGKPVFNKIQLIKLIRQYGSECNRMAQVAKEAETAPGFGSLRAAKVFVEKHWNSFDKST